MTKKIVLIDDAYPINSRNTRILMSIHRELADDEIHVLDWDREHTYTSQGEPWLYHHYQHAAKYGNKWQKLIGLFGFRRFCRHQIRAIRPDIVIASHWNNLLMLPSLSANQKLIYENLDAPTGPYFVRKILGIIEQHYMQKALVTVHASRFYTELYSPRYPQLVVENKPTQEIQAFPYKAKKPLRIAFLGNIRYLDVLKNLVDAVRNNADLELTFHGSGPDLQALQQYIGPADNIRCTGAYQYKDMPELYASTDLVWAAYPNKDFNVKYAISNKFHESMAYAIPAIYASETQLGDFVVREKIGWEVNPYSVSDIQQLLSRLLENHQLLNECHQNIFARSNKLTTWDQEIKPLIELLNKQTLSSK